MTGPSPPETELARWATDVRWEDLPPATRGHVETIWLDATANAFAGRHAANTARMEQLTTALTGAGDHTVIGGPPLSATGAAFLNGFQITAYTMCDVYRPVLCHVTPEVIPALLIAIEHAEVREADVLIALAVGLEVTVRIGLALDDAGYRARRWHAPGVIGPFGAAAAAGRILGFDEDTLLAAWGLAGSQAAGTFVALGTSAVKFHQARGATSGVFAALFAEAGFGGARRAITAPDGGLLASHADGGHPDRLVADLGDRWHLDDIALRRWPAASSLQAVVESVLALRDEHGLRRDDVESIEVALPEQSFDLCADKPWSDELSAMQSARYVTATVLDEGRCWLDQYTAAHRESVDIGRFATDHVQVLLDGELPRAAAVVTVRRRGGSEVTERRDVPLGDPDRPLSSDDVRSKFEDALASAGRRVDAAELWSRLAAVDRESDLLGLLAALGAPGHPASDRHDEEPTL